MIEIKDKNNIQNELAEYLNECENNKIKQDESSDDEDAKVNENPDDDEQDMVHEDLYDVLTSYIDFRELIIAQKFVKALNEGSFDYNFNNLTLSSLILKMRSNSDFFHHETV